MVHCQCGARTLFIANIYILACARELLSKGLACFSKLSFKLKRVMSGLQRLNATSQFYREAHNLYVAENVRAREYSCVGF